MALTGLLVLWFLVCSAAGLGLGIWLARRGGQRWECQACVHAYTAHIDPGGAATACQQGVFGIGCSCRAYVGRVPPRRLVRLPAAEAEPQP